MKVTLFWIVICLAPATASAVEVYACKGKNGETVYTNVQCPDPGTTKVIGSYTKVPDDPRQMRDAAMEVQRIDARNAAAAAAAAQVRSYSSYEDPSDYADAPPATSSRNVNELSEYYRKKSNPLAEHGKDRTASGSYTNDLSDGYANKGMLPPRRVRSDDDNITSPHSPNIPQPAPEITDCRGGTGGGVTCYDTAGNASFGNTRNGAVFDSNGNAQYLQRNGNGQLQTDNGTCVKDIYGKCQ